MSDLENILKDLNQTLQKLCILLEKDLEFREREFQWRMETAKRIEEQREKEAKPSEKPTLEEALPPVESDEDKAPVGWLRKQLDSEHVKYELYETNEGFTVRIWAENPQTLRKVRNWVKWARTRMIEKLSPEKAKEFSDKFLKGGGETG
jgi:hypothetical protein